MNTAHLLANELPPDPGVLLRSLRGIGYSVEDAVADIVDNGISAEAQRVDIWLRSVESDFVVDIVDDGDGLSFDELVIALTLGSRERDPARPRRGRDLGRFGLGLKTASFSVAQRMTLYSVQDGVAHGAAWDLETVARTGKWQLCPMTAVEGDELAARLSGRASGTVVRWSRTDRLSPGSGVKRLAALARLEERLRGHLGMTYHRFLDGIDADGSEIPRVNIALNNRPLVGWNPLVPFTDRNERVQLGEVRCAHGVRVEYAVLPPESHLNAQEREQATLDGRRLTDMQGFYVYRCNRLVCVASWLGLPGLGDGRWNKDTSTQLARIAVDLTNAEDEEWSLDVRKSRVIPPDRMRSALIDMGTEARARSRARLFGRTTSSTEGADARSASLWTLQTGKLKVNRAHPLVSSILNAPEATPGALRAAVRSLLRQLESSPSLVPFVAEPTARESEAAVSAPEVLDDADFGEALELGRFLIRSGRPLDAVLSIAAEDPRYAGSPALLDRLRARLEVQ